MTFSLPKKCTNGLVTGRAYVLIKPQTDLGSNRTVCSVIVLPQNVASSLAPAKSCPAPAKSCLISNPGGAVSQLRSLVSSQRSPGSPRRVLSRLGALPCLGVAPMIAEPSNNGSWGHVPEPGIILPIKALYPRITNLSQCHRRLSGLRQGSSLATHTRARTQFTNNIFNIT